MTIRTIALVTFVVLAAGAACEPTSNTIEANDLKHARGAFVFAAPRATVLTEVVQVLAEHGYTVAAPDPSATRLSSAVIAKTETQPGSQVLVRVIPLAVVTDGFLLRISELVFNDDGTIMDNLRRDDWEWDIAERTEPDRTVELTNRARARGDDYHRHTDR